MSHSHLGHRWEETQPGCSLCRHLPGCPSASQESAPSPAPSQNAPQGNTDWVKGGNLSLWSCSPGDDQPSSQGPQGRAGMAAGALRCTKPVFGWLGRGKQQQLCCPRRRKGREGQGLPGPRLPGSLREGRHAGAAAASRSVPREILFLFSLTNV